MVNDQDFVKLIGARQKEGTGQRRIRYSFYNIITFAFNLNLIYFSGFIGSIFYHLLRIAGTTSYVSSTSIIPLRPQSSQTNAAGSGKCSYFPVDATYISGSYQVSSSALDVSFGSATQCQGISLIYSVSVTGKSSLPSWITYSSSSPIVTIKPSMITSKEDLGSYSVIVSFLSTTIVPLISSTTFTVTFIKTPPALANTVGNQIIYKGMGLTSITIPSNIFSGTYTLTASNNLSGVTATVFSLSGFTLSIQMPNSYQGSFTVTLTATDDFTQTTTTSFVVTVSSCPQTNWAEWKGSGSTDCTLCASGSVLSLGIWSSTSSSSSSSSSSTQTESYLNRNISPISPQGIGAPIALAVASIIVSSLVSGASPVTAGFGVFQWQNIQILSMIDMNTPDNYVSYSQGFEVTKLDFKFVNFISLQSSLKDSTRRFLSNNDYKSMTNIGFGSSHFLVNYWYFLLFFRDSCTYPYYNIFDALN